MSAAIRAITKLAAVKISPMAQIKPLLCPIPGAFKLPHQKIGVKQEDYETRLDYRSPNVFHRRTLACQPQGDNGVLA
jgi:hypothetical protein